MYSKMVCVASVVVFIAASSRADIYRWDNGQVIPGTEGITPGPGVNLGGWNTGPHNLRYADFSAGLDLSGANFGGSWLDYAHFQGANLSNARLYQATLTNADLSGATVTGANFAYTGLTKEQLYSTASYQAKNLQGINLGENNLGGWDFSGQNLNGVSFSFGCPDPLCRVARLAEANLSGATVNGADFSFATYRGFTKEQLYSTASYQAKNLQGISLWGNDLSGWDLSGQNLTNAGLGWVYGTNGNLTGADLRGAYGYDEFVMYNGITKNTIGPYGEVIDGLDLASGDRLVVRNYHGNPGDPDSPIGDPGPLPVSITDHMTMADGGVLQLLFDADPWDSYIFFQPGIPIQLGGTLELTFADGTDLATQVGRTLHIFNCPGVSPTGQFHVASPYAWDTKNLYTTGDVSLLSVIVGDMNGDGTVDALDAGLMFGNWGNSGQGDLNLDGIVDAADAGLLFEKWTGDSAAVPEPSSLQMCAGAVGLLLRRRSHRAVRPDKPQRFPS